MYSKFQLSLKYLSYYFSASNRKGHGMHSPFVFEFITRVLNDKTVYPAYTEVEDLRQQLLRDKTLLSIEDFGAGSAVDKTNQRTIASIAKNAVKPAKFGQLLYRMVRHYQPQNVLELGTSLGITTSYLSLAKPDAKLITIEGAAAIAETARQNFAQLAESCGHPADKTLKLLLGSTFGQNVEIVTGNFDVTLSSVISQLSTLDFAFIDGNHRREPTVKYFNQLLTVTNNDSILIFDDIHWSKEMEQAWETIKQHHSVRCTIDLFFIGIVLFRKEFKEKRHFTVHF